MGGTAASVLIVDCETRVLRTMGTMLRLKGHAVDCAASPDEALRAVLGGLRPALMIVEFVLPAMDGVTLAEQIRRSLPGLAVIIASTGAADLPDRLAQRGFGVLAKPFRGETLDAAVEAALCAQLADLTLHPPM
jgi:DNA-binding response OmpR family regulator